MRNKNNQLLMIAFILATTFFSLPLKAQVTIGKLAPPDQSAVLQVISTDSTKGVLIPEMSAAKMGAILNPANGLIIYNTTDSCVNYFNGKTWISLCHLSTPAAWLLNGNTGTNPATNFVGTIDNQPLVFKVNGTINGTKRAGYISNMADASNFNSFGLGALAVNSGANNNAFGYNALAANTTGANNNAFGNGALAANTTGTDNVAVGYQALVANTTGKNSVAVGDNASAVNATGLYNTAVGSNAMGNAKGNVNVSTAIGYRALYNTTVGNTAVGSNALSTNTSGSNNAAFGINALDANTIGSFNSAFGDNVLFGNTTANSVSAFGYQAMYQNTTGSNNSAFGSNALFGNQTGAGNAAFGDNALSSNFAGNNNTALGHLAGNALTSGDNNIVIGANVDLPIATGSNQINIGNALYGTTSTTQAGGSISIGKTAPDAGVTLDVKGTFQYADGNQGLNKVLTSDANGLASWKNAQGTAKSLATNGLSLTVVNDSVQLGGTLTKKTDINMNGQNLVFKRLASGTGNVGIGSLATPRAPLEVQGNAGEDPLILSPVKLASETPNAVDAANPTYYNLQISEQGVVRKTPAKASAPLVTNGLSLTAVNDSVQLGGALTKNTTISAAGNDTLKISAPLAITSGNPGADKVLTSDSTGNVSWLTLPKLIEKTFIVSKDDNIDRSYTVTNEDLVRLKISTGTEYTLTLPTDPSVTVGRILYVTNVGNGSMSISPLPANNTYQQIDAGYSYIFLYAGNGKWYIVSGF